MRHNFNIQDWIKWLRVKGLSDRSIKEYISYITRMKDLKLDQEYLVNFLSKHNNQVCRASIINLLQYIKTHPDTPQEIKGCVQMIELPKVTGRKRKKVLTIINEPELFDLVKKMNSERDKIMALLSFYCGLRQSELVGQYRIIPDSFNWSHWIRDPSKAGILIIEGKGNKQRKVFVPQKLMSRIFNWIKHDISQRQGRDDPLFNIEGRRWHDILDTASKKALNRHINPHLLRHSCSQWLKSLGWDVRERQIFLGHEDISTTTIYDSGDVMELASKYSNTVNESLDHLRNFE